MRSFFSKLATVDEKILSNNETKIVDYIKTNLQDVVESNMKIERLAQEIGTGYSAIYTLLNKLKFQGYKDFVISLSNDWEARKYQISNSDDEITSGYIHLIRENYSLMEKRSLFDSINLIRNANRTFVCYWERAMMGPAAELSNFFYRQRFNVHLLNNDQDTIYERVQASNNDDLFIFYTRTGSSTRLQAVISEIQKTGAKIIFISGKVPSSKFVTSLNSVHSLMVEAPDKEVFKWNFSKSVPFHYFNDLLIYNYASKFGDKGDI